MKTRDALRNRIAPLEMTPSEFRKVGRQLVERVAEFLCTLHNRPVAPNESPSTLDSTHDFRMVKLSVEIGIQVVSLVGHEGAEWPVRRRNTAIA